MYYGNVKEKFLKKNLIEGKKRAEESKMFTETAP